MEIRTVEQRDLPQILALYRQLLPFPFPVTEEEMAQTFTKLLHDEDCFVLVAAEGSTVLGTVTAFVCTTLAAPFLVVEDVVVAENTRGKGIGTRLFQSVDDLAKAHRCQYSILVSSGYRSNAHRFYEKVGYVDDVVGFRKMYE